MPSGSSQDVRTVAAKQLDPIIIKGNHFFYKTNGSQFFFRGIRYNPPALINDILVDVSSCYNDIAAIVSLGVNVLLVSGIELTQDHSYCMNQFQAAGIYVFVRLSGETFSGSSITIETGALFSTPSWNDDIYSFQVGIIDAFSQYNNVIGFVISFQLASAESLPFIKAATRDLKAYMKSNNYRDIPIALLSYSSSRSPKELSYLRCGSAAAAIIDFWTIGDPFCDPSDQLSLVQTAGEAYQQFNIPLVFYQPICSINSSYPWLNSLYGPQPIWSGGIPDFWQDGENDGLLNSLYRNKTARYTALSKSWATITPTVIQASVYTPIATQTIACPTKDATFSVSLSLPPVPDRELCACMMTSINCAFPPTVIDSTLYDIIPSLCRANSTNCIGIMASGISGVYGAYSGCRMYQQASWALNRYAMNQIILGNSTACNISSYAKTQTLSVSPSCSSMVLAAGVLGNTVASAKTSIVTSLPTDTGMDQSGNNRHLPTAAYGGIAAAGVVVLAILIGALICYQKVAKKRAGAAAEGLEVGEAPFEFGNVKNVELVGESAKAELWTNRNTIELPCMEVDFQDPNLSGPPENHNLLPTEASRSTSVGTRVESSDGNPAAESEAERIEFASSWGDGAWFDPNDPREVLPSPSSPDATKKST